MAYVIFRRRVPQTSIKFATVFKISEFPTTRIDPNLCFESSLCMLVSALRETPPPTAKVCANLLSSCQTAIQSVLLQQLEVGSWNTLA